MNCRKQRDLTEVMEMPTQLLESEEGPNGELVQNLIAFSRAHSALRRQLRILLQS